MAKANSKAKAKPQSLRDEIEALPGMIGRRGTLSWDKRLRHNNPKLMEEIDKEIDRFHAGEWDHKFAGALSFGRWISPKVGVSEDAVARYIMGRKRGNS